MPSCASDCTPKPQNGNYGGEAEALPPLRTARPDGSARSLDRDWTDSLSPVDSRPVNSPRAGPLRTVGSCLLPSRRAPAHPLECLAEVDEASPQDQVPLDSPPSPASGFRAVRKWLISRQLRRGLAAGAALAAVGVAVLAALHPLVLPQRGTMQRVDAALNGWQAAMLLPLPDADRRAGHASLELIGSLNGQAAAGLREVGTAAFAAHQAAIRHGDPTIIVRSSHRISALQFVRRFWNGDLLVSADLHTRVRRALFDPKRGTWHTPVTTVTFVTIRCRLRDTLGAWRIVSVAPQH